MLQPIRRWQSSSLFLHNSTHPQYTSPPPRFDYLHTLFDSAIIRTTTKNIQMKHWKVCLNVKIKKIHSWQLTITVVGFSEVEELSGWVELLLTRYLIYCDCFSDSAISSKDIFLKWLRFLRRLFGWVLVYDIDLFLDIGSMSENLSLLVILRGLSDKLSNPLSSVSWINLEFDESSSERAEELPW